MEVLLSIIRLGIPTLDSVDLYLLCFGATNSVTRWKCLTVFMCVGAWARATTLPLHTALVLMMFPHPSHLQFHFAHMDIHLRVRKLPTSCLYRVCCCIHLTYVPCLFIISSHNLLVCMHGRHMLQSRRQSKRSSQGVVALKESTMKLVPPLVLVAQLLILCSSLHYRILRPISHVRVFSFLLQTYNDLLVLSLGTGTQTVGHHASQVAKWGPKSWIVNKGDSPLVDMVYNGSADMVDYNLSIIFHSQKCSSNYLRIQVNNLSRHCHQYAFCVLILKCHRSSGCRYLVIVPFLCENSREDD